MSGEVHTDKILSLKDWIDSFWHFQEEDLNFFKNLLTRGKLPNVEEILKEKGFKVKSLNAEEVAKELGSLKIENTVLLGCLSICLHFKKGIWEEVISSAVPPNTVELNLKAFNKGREIGGMLFLEQKD